MSTRPSRNALPPGPLANTFYCRTCGRVISPRKSRTTQSTPQRYCSDRCRREKPRPSPSTEADIERAFVRLLGEGRERRIVKCEEVERAIFTKTRMGDGIDSENLELSHGDRPEEDGQSDAEEPEEETEEDDGGGIRLPCNTEPPRATTTIIKPISAGRPHKTLRERGMQKAKEREMVRRAARRGVAFGFELEEGKKRSVEAIQRGRVVESSFAKGEWGVRWRE